MRVLFTVAIGEVGAQPLDWIETAAAEWFPFPVERLAPLAIPEGSYDRQRGQYQSVEFLKSLAAAAPPRTARILGITEADIAIPMLSFLFGQAQFNGPVALVSLCRLRQEFYGLPPDAALLQERAVKEVLHELGHTFGLTHCENAVCTMSLSTDITLVDAKGERFCARCGAQLARGFTAGYGETR